jgi:hypothetical protein
MLKPRMSIYDSFLHKLMTWASLTCTTLVDLAFAGLIPYLKDKLDVHEFSDTNQLLQRALPYENHAKSSRF